MLAVIYYQERLSSGAEALAAPFVKVYALLLLVAAGVPTATTTAPALIVAPVLVVTR